MLIKAKQQRCYSRILQGIKRHKNDNDNVLRFLTLCSVPEQKKEIAEAFNNLNREIKHLSVEKLIHNNYLNRNKATFYYGHEYQKIRFKFHFCRIRTTEGYSGVFHILFFGQYIPREWIADTWQRLLNVERMSEHTVDIRKCKKEIHDEKRLAYYCVSQYVSKQTKYVKYYCSFNWVYKGFWNDYYDLMRLHKELYILIDWIKFDKAVFFMIVAKTIKQSELDVCLGVVNLNLKEYYKQERKNYAYNLRLK